MKCRSEWQSPATALRIRTSRGPGFGTLTSSICSGLLTSNRTAAFMGTPFILCFLNLVSVNSLRCRKQFANLCHADGALAEQVAGDRTLRGTFRQLERIARGYAMVDDHAR